MQGELASPDDERRRRVGEAIAMAILALAFPAIGIYATAKFAPIFADLGIRLPPATRALLGPLPHVVAACVLLVLAVASTRSRLVWYFATVLALYVVITVVAMFLPLMVTIEFLGPEP